MSDLSAKIKSTTKGNPVNTTQMKIRYNELMRLAKNADFFSMTELDELIRLSKDLGLIGK
jgi:hypothetical protein